MPHSDFVTWYGRDEAPPRRIALRAGRVTAAFQDGDLRSVRLGGAELARRIYVAVRDVDWGTVPGDISDLRIHQDEATFRIAYTCTHRRGEISFDWTATFAGAADGTITCAMDGVTRDEFRFSRIGFCVLHPTAPGAGAAYRATTESGPLAGILPRLIEPPRIVDGVYQPLVPSYTALEIEQLDGVDVHFAFEGDQFEMEDERSWTDASFKTYCTPYAVGIQSASPGQRIHQKITLNARARSAIVVASTAVALPAPTVDPGNVAAPAGPVALTLGAGMGRTLPALGLGCARGGIELSDREVDQLQLLRLDHLRVELRLREPAYPSALARASREAIAVGSSLELALFVTDDAERELSALAERLAGVPVARVLVFHEPEASLEATEARWVRLARRCLGAAVGGAPIGGGTNGNLAELVWTLHGTDAMDVVAYTANPQVHASDETSIMENLATLAATVATATSHAGGRDVAVSRLTLKPPFGAYAIAPEAPPAPGELPSYIDPRQMSLFGAGWALGSLKYLAEAGAASVTIGETVGGAGLMERMTGSVAPARFRSEPGMVFPMFHVLADLAAWRRGELIDCTSAEPLAAIGLAVRDDTGLGIILANLGWETRRVEVGPLPAGRATARVLDSASAAMASWQPRQFRASGRPPERRGDVISLALGPYASATVRIRPTDRHAAGPERPARRSG